MNEDIIKIEIICAHGYKMVVYTDNNSKKQLYETVCGFCCEDGK